MRPKRYPYSGKMKKTTAGTVVLKLDKESINRSACQKSQLLHREFGLGIESRTAFC